MQSVKCNTVELNDCCFTEGNESAMTADSLARKLEQWFFEEVSSMSNWKSHRLMLTSARSIVTWWIKCTAKRSAGRWSVWSYTTWPKSVTAEHFTSESLALTASTHPGRLSTIFWNQSGGICSHSATRALVRSTTDVGRQGLALSLQLII